MSDIFDIASLREEEDRALAAQRARGGLNGKTLADSARFCRLRRADFVGAPPGLAGRAALRGLPNYF